MPGGTVFLPAKAWSHWLFEVVCGTCEEATTQWWSSSVMRPRSKARSCRALSRGAVRRHEALARRGRRPRLDVACREQGRNVDARETAGATIVGKKHTAEVVLVDALANLLEAFQPKLLWPARARRV